jgi:uncharacterized protein DUF1236
MIAAVCCLSGSCTHKNYRILPRVIHRFFRNDIVHIELIFGCALEIRRALIGKELSMRTKLLAIAAIAGAIAAPLAAQAQGGVTTGTVRGGVAVDEDLGIAVDQRPAFREYVIRERVPDYSISERVIVGGVLPESGVTYYDVPQTFGVTPYRYTVVNGRTVLVEPRSRRIVQVIE